MASKVRSAFGNLPVIRRQMQADVFSSFRNGSIDLDEAQVRLSKL
jgi:hypothetical protein